MTSIATVQAAVRGHLRDAGLVRPPRVAGTAPPMHLEPRPGPLAPGGRADSKDPAATRETTGNLVVSMRASSEPARGLVDLSTRVAVFDLVYRSKGSDGMLRGRELHDAIVSELVVPAGFGQGLAINPSGDPDDDSANPTVWALAIDLVGGLSPLGGPVDGVHTDMAKLAVEWLRR